MRGCAGVVHLAGVTHARRPGSYRLVNVDGTRVLVSAAEEEGVGRFVFVSSRTATEKGGAYSVSKLDAEAIVRSSKLAWTIVRLPEVYGAGGAEGVDRIIRRAVAGEPIVIAGRGQDEVCPMHLEDAVAACLGALTAQAAVRQTYTLAGECMTTRRFAEVCLAHLGSKSRIVKVPSWVVRVACVLARVLPLPVYPDQFDRLKSVKPPPSAHASRELGFVSRSLESGLDAL